MGVRISPSILSADVANLAGELERIRGADAVHVDVMDNHFVPNLTWGLPVARACVRLGVLPVDAHLMIEDPDRFAPAYAQAGCASVTFHLEAATAPVRLARELRRLGARAGVALRPTTSLAGLAGLLGEFDRVLVMTVEPGFGGQPFMPAMLDKVRALREAIRASGAAVSIQVDGGISRTTIGEVARAGADDFVAGSAVFGAPDPAARVRALREAALAGLR